MSDNYYENLLNNIKTAMTAGKYQDANKLIEDEMSMPYVPLDVLRQLEELHKETQSQLIREKPLTVMTSEELKKALCSDSEGAFGALKSLHNSNIRNYLDIVEECLKDQKIHHLIKAMLLELLIEQNVQTTVRFVDERQDLTINTADLPSALKQKSLMMILDKLNELVSKNPSFLQQCQMVAINAAYDRYPQLINEDECDKYTFSIIRYVYRSYGDERGWIQFANWQQIDEKELLEFSF